MRSLGAPLLRDPSRVGRPQRRTVSIVPPRAFARREELASLLVGPVAEAILEIATAAAEPGGVPGDSSFCILDARLADGATYLQYLADPGQLAPGRHGSNLLWEVASGEWSAHQHALTQEEAAALHDLGFTLRGTPGNARRFAPVSSVAEALDVARRSVDVLIEVLRFDGRGPVNLQIFHDASAERGSGEFLMLAPEPDLASLLHQAGDSTAESCPGGARARAHGHPFVVRKDERRRAGPYERLLFATTWPCRLPSRAVEKLEHDFRGCRLRNEADGRLSLRMDVLLRVGAPIAQLAAWLEEWRRAVGSVARGGEPATIS